VGLGVLRRSKNLLHGPAVAVRVAEKDEQAPGEVLDLADIYPPFHELSTSGLYVRDDQLNALEGTRLRPHDPRP
jgi:hypothetical protein